eukprot:UN34735
MDTCRDGDNPYPRTDFNGFEGILDACGGHTQEYHFHEGMTCLYDATMEAVGHSAQIAKMNDGQYLYGRWENGGT